MKKADPLDIEEQQIGPSKLTELGALSRQRADPVILAPLSFAVVTRTSIVEGLESGMRPLSRISSTQLSEIQFKPLQSPLNTVRKTPSAHTFG